MYGPLLVTDQDVTQPVAVVVECVVDGDDGAAGVAEQRVDSLDQERFEQRLRAGHAGTVDRLLLIGG